MKWITRERPKIDRIACPWLIKRFIDPQADILYVPPADVVAVAQCEGAIPFDDPALAKLAEIVRAADTDTLERSPQAPGLLAITLGLAANIPNDQELLSAGRVLYDALYRWCQSLTGEHHGWYPEALKAEMEARP